MKAILSLFFLLFSVPVLAGSPAQSILYVSFQGPLPPFNPNPNPIPISPNPDLNPSSQIDNLASQAGLNIGGSQWPMYDLGQNGIETGWGFFVGDSATIANFESLLPSLSFATSVQIVTNLDLNYDLLALRGNQQVGAIDDVIVISSLTPAGLLNVQGGCEQMAAGFPTLSAAQYAAADSFVVHYTLLQDQIAFSNSYTITLSDGSTQILSADTEEMCGVSGGGMSVGNH